MDSEAKFNDLYLHPTFASSKSVNRYKQHFGSMNDIHSNPYLDEELKEDQSVSDSNSFSKQKSFALPQLTLRRSCND